MTRAATIAALLSALLAPVAQGQEPPVVRRVVRTSFPIAVTASAGLGFGAIRGSATQPDCLDRPCVDFGVGSGWQARVDVQVPIGRTLGIELGGQLGRQALKVCQSGACTVVDHLWAYRGTALLLWRFKPRAPIFFGVGGAVAHFSTNPVYAVQGPATEPGFAGVVGLDLAVAQRVGVRVAWRNFFMLPGSIANPSFYPKGTAWEQSLMFGARVNLGK
jgi:opacity protein-like surface antigen